MRACWRRRKGTVVAMVAWLWLCYAIVSVAGKPGTNSIPIVGLHAFERMTLAEPRDHTFRLPNTGSTVLRVRKVRSSCVCLHILSYPTAIDAGGSGAFCVRLVPDKTGQVKYRAYLECEDEANPVRMVVVTADVGAGTAAGSPMPTPAVDAGLLARSLGRADSDCYVDVETFTQKLAEGDETVVVDVRPPSEYAAVHLESAINMPPYAVKTKRFLRDKEVVLVDVGYGWPSLEKECRRSRESGFRSVHILRGGLRAWQTGGGGLVGTPRALRELGAVSPEDLYVARQHREWLVVDAGSAVDARTQYWFPDAIRMAPAGGDGSPLFSWVQALLAEREGVTHVLVVTDDGCYDTLPCTDWSGVPATVFYLRGGVDAFEVYLKRATAMRRRQKGRNVGRSSPASPSRRGASCGGCS